ncbi:MAG: hypothetical protein PHS14_12045 [Elusimicrobia bacterium]|nr:hypothetical protein [Elusimicrobiota bacterium]
MTRASLGRALLFAALAARCLRAEPPVVAASTRCAAGLLLPDCRIVSYYGNPLSKRMGILGEIPVEEMLKRLEAQSELWRRADPGTPVLPALELVATVASGTPGPDGLYRNRMPDALVEKVIGWAARRNWLVILDVQIGRSTVRAEVERLRPFLERPNVHLALDPEFDMPRGLRPGQRIGTSDGEDVNVAVILLSSIAARGALPPKLLIVHRFTNQMLKRHERIRLDPRVQIAVVMDGFGPPSLKRKIYRVTVKNEPVQQAGIKLFYKNDKPLMSPADVLKLEPAPRVIIYQ